MTLSEIQPASGEKSSVFHGSLFTLKNNEFSGFFRGTHGLDRNRVYAGSPAAKHYLRKRKRSVDNQKYPAEARRCAAPRTN